MGEEILPETLLEQFRASQDRQSRAMVLYRPPTNLVERMLGGGGCGRGEPDGEEAAEGEGSPPPGAEKADLAMAAADGSSDENSSSGSGSSAVSRRGSTKDSAVEDVDMS